MEPCDCSRPIWLLWGSGGDATNIYRLVLSPKITSSTFIAFTVEYLTDCLQLNMLHCKPMSLSQKDRWR
eukprot:3580262-Amphidinium_carterae.1